jgi:hypothetical protein
VREREQFVSATLLPCCDADGLAPRLPAAGIAAPLGTGYTHLSCAGSRLTAHGRIPRRITLRLEVRRSLKTQQHAHLGLTQLAECVSRFDTVDPRPAWGEG